MRCVQRVLKTADTLQVFLWKYRLNGKSGFQTSESTYFIFCHYCHFLNIKHLTNKVFNNSKRLFLTFLAETISKLTRVNPDRNIFSINVELTSTFLRYRGLVHHHHRILNVSLKLQNMCDILDQSKVLIGYPFESRNAFHLWSTNLLKLPMW